MLTRSLAEVLALLWAGDATEVAVGRVASVPCDVAQEQPRFYARTRRLTASGAPEVEGVISAHEYCALLQAGALQES